jgi:hypothetical protein
MVDFRAARRPREPGQELFDRICEDFSARRNLSGPTNIRPPSGQFLHQIHFEISCARFQADRRPHERGQELVGNFGVFVSSWCNLSRPTANWTPSRRFYNKPQQTPLYHWNHHMGVAYLLFSQQWNQAELESSSWQQQRPGSWKQAVTAPQLALSPAPDKPQKAAA